MTERLPALLDGRTRVVAVTQASNTLGTRPDLRPVIDEAHRVGAVVVVDGCQGCRARRCRCESAGLRFLRLLRS